MKASLEKELSGLSLEEKNEVLSFLIPFVIPSDDESVSEELLVKLDERITEDDRHPDLAISFEQFEQRWAHRK